jgi:hypothetical protein
MDASIFSCRQLLINDIFAIELMSKGLSRCIIIEALSVGYYY